MTKRSARRKASLYHFRRDKGRRFFHAEENPNEVASDRESEMRDRAVRDLIIAALRAAAGGSRADVVDRAESAATVPP